MLKIKMSKHSLLLSASLLVLFVAALSFPATQKENENSVMAARRQARSVMQFGKMIQCVTKRSPYDYIDYGCWCGIGGQGTPLDALDMCCYIHDKCYDAAMGSNVCDSSWKVYIASYRYTACDTCDPVTSYPANEQHDAYCKRFLCGCDSAAARCFSQSFHNSSFVGYNYSDCK